MPPYVESDSNVVLAHCLRTSHCLFPVRSCMRNIEPLAPADVSTSACASHAQAYRANIICPNKHVSGGEQMYDNHPLESETYIGGKVRIA